MFSNSNFCAEVMRQKLPEGGPDALIDKRVRIIEGINDPIDVRLTADGVGRSRMGRMRDENDDDFRAGS
jgi:hypothetical protein